MLLGLYSHMTVLWIKHFVNLQSYYLIYLQEGNLNFSLHMLNFYYYSQDTCSAVKVSYRAVML